MGAGAPALPRKAEKKIRRNLQRKFVSSPPAHQVYLQAEQESIFRTVSHGRGDLKVTVAQLVVLDRF